MSSSEEEMRLLEYFRKGNVPEDLDVDRLHFLALADMQNEDIEVPEDLESNILSRLAVEQRPVRRLNSRFLYTVTSIAAGMAIIVSTYLFLNRQPDLGTYDDPQVAYAETKEALDMVSKYFNKGTSELSELKAFNQAVEPLGQLKKVEKASTDLKYLNKFQVGVEKTRGIIGND
jgi:hypothetical protein